MNIFYTPDINSEFYTLSEDESRHCVRVLRLTAGDPVCLVDGRGGMYETVIEDASAKGCTVRVVRHTTDYGRRPYYIHIALAPTKNIDRYEWFLEKATEIGVDHLTPMLTEHSERKIVKQERSEKIVVSAIKQSLKAFCPVVDPLRSFADIVATPFDGDKFIAHCEADRERLPLSSAITKGGRCLILIGPEGDFSQSEIETARQAGFREISLGDSRLRTETAGVVASHTVALVNSL